MWRGQVRALGARSRCYSPGQKLGEIEDIEISPSTGLGRIKNVRKFAHVQGIFLGSRLGAANTPSSSSPLQASKSLTALPLEEARVPHRKDLASPFHGGARSSDNVTARSEPLSARHSGMPDRNEVAVRPSSGQSEAQRGRRARSKSPVLSAAQAIMDLHPLDLALLQNPFCPLLDDEDSRGAMHLGVPTRRSCRSSRKASPSVEHTVSEPASLEVGEHQSQSPKKKFFAWAAQSQARTRSLTPRASGRKSFPKRPRNAKLSSHAWQAIEELFRMMDADGSRTVTREEAETFFKGAFSKISADAMFNEVDTDRSGAITAEEFTSFWIQVRAAGYKEQDILQEIDELMAGNAWVDWRDGRDTEQPRARIFPKRPFLCKLSAPAWKKCEELFLRIDSSGNMIIVPEEAEQFFKGPFHHLSAQEMFKRVDVHGHGSITAEDFMMFWVGVRMSGYKDKEIIDEIDELLTGSSWVDWKPKRSSHAVSGKYQMKRPLLCRLSPRVWGQCIELFKKMDGDGSQLLTKDKAAQFFKGAYHNMSADEMFQRMDLNGTSTISLEEFLSYWVHVRCSGYKDKDIEDEVQSMLDGGPWVQFMDGRTLSPQ